MKKLFTFAASGLVALAAVSCTSETTEPNDPGGQTPGENTFTFTLPSSSSVITYAGEVPASENEKKLDLANTSILMFDEAGTLEAIVEGSLITAGMTPEGKATATIAVPDDWKGDKTFYLIGNTQMDAYDNLPEAGDIGTMTAAEFLELTTEAQAGQISSTNGLLMSGVVPVTDIEQSAGSDITLYRSVARFDVDQDVTENKVTIKSISVSEANLNGYIVAYGRGVKPGALTTGDVNGITVSQALTLVDVDGTPEDDTDDHNFQKQEGAFYLYPTYLKTDGTGTMITLIGDVNGQEAIYTMNKEESDLPEDLEILANTRYIISSIDELTHTFTITIAEWDEGEEIVGRPGVNGENFGLLTDPAGSAVASFEASTGTILLNATGGEVTFTVKSSSSRGTMFALTPKANMADHTELYDFDLANATAPTYAIPYFASTYTITVPDLTEAGAASTEMLIKDFRDQEHALKLRLVYGEETVVIDEILIPDPALREALKLVYGIEGTMVREELEAVKAIEISASTVPDAALRNAIASLEGLENFTNIEDFTFRGTGLSEIDHDLLAGWENLDYLYLYDSPITSLDLSGLDKLEQLRLNGADLTSLHIDGRESLTYIYIVNSREITTLTLNGDFPNVTRMHFSSNSITTINANGNFPQTESVEIISNQVLTLDFLTATQFPAVKVLRLSNNPNLTDIGTDIYNSTILERFEIDDTQIGNVDLSSPVLTRLEFRNTPVPQVDLSRHPALTTLTVGHLVEELDLTACPDLTTLNISNNSPKIRTIDMSNNVKLKSLTLNSCPDLTEIRVWDGFPIADPASWFTTYNITGATPVPPTFVVVEGHEFYDTGAGLLPAVRVGDLWWAPVNVGATQVDEPGFLFQWGRNVPLLPQAYTPTGSKLSFEEGNAADGQFVSDGSEAWHTEEGTTEDTWYSLKNAAYTHGDPCPTGYRLPTLDDVETIVPSWGGAGYASFTTCPTTVSFQDAYSWGWIDLPHPFYFVGNGIDVMYRYIPETFEVFRYTDTQTHWELSYMVLDGSFDAASSSLQDFENLAWDTASTLQFPTAGSIVRGGGNFVPEESNLWLRDATKSNVEGNCIRYIRGGQFYLGANNRANAHPVRCVKDAE